MLQGAGKLGQLHRNVFCWRWNVGQVDGNLTEIHIQILKPISWDEGYFICHVGTSGCEEKLLSWIAEIVEMVGISGTAGTAGTAG